MAVEGTGSSERRELIQVSLEGNHRHPYNNQHPECSPCAPGTVLFADIALPCHPRDNPVE